jgi:hypothetical protein
MGFLKTPSETLKNVTFGEISIVSLLTQEGRKTIVYGQSSPSSGAGTRILGRWLVKGVVAEQVMIRAPPGLAPVALILILLLMVREVILRQCDGASASFSMERHRQVFVGCQVRQLTFTMCAGGKVELHPLVLP